ncbi:unnamed protein product [Peronospora farinosa]|uniref:RING-type domain-containing protein n=1 Tax=Peronospora farinosa TaxID=134698 RepID=A0AAV0TJ95_9STRA|nr:unnamed protein product [Peronospora farinosa]CAI5721238.1 unnamed protein product [Peronospora farinosa]
MFVMINATDNPWMVALLLFVQVVMPLLQSNAADNEGASLALNVAILFLLGLSLLTFWKATRFCRVLYQLRGQHPEMGWVAFFREAYTQVAAVAAQRDAHNPNRGTQENMRSETFNRTLRTIQVMPTEEFKTPEELKEASIADLKQRLERRDVDFTGCVERQELVELLVKYRGGPSNNDTCCICCDEYETGDVLRLLRKCKHEFHLECLDKWAFTSVNLQRVPSCPLSAAFSTQTASSTPVPILLSYGDGFLGALGTGNYENVLRPTPLPTTTGLSVKSISVGWAHAGFVTNDGDAYIYGRTHSFRDVIRTTNMQRILPKIVWWMNNFTRARGVDTLEPALLELSEGERVKKIVCSTALTFLLTESGKLFTLGANGYGQCGIGEESVSVQLPVHVDIDGDEIVDIAAGYQHGLAVTKDGTVFTWGKGERGQLGFGTGNVDAPQEVIALKGKKIAIVGAGFNYSCAVSEDGELYMWGKLLNPKAKKDESSVDQIVPRLVRTSDAVKLFKCSQFHTTFITADDKIWLVGRTPSGRQESNDFFHVASQMHTTPLQITNDQVVRAKDIVEIGKGVDKSSFVTADGRAYEWNFESGIHQVKELTDFKVVSLESGFHYRLLLAQSKK